MFCLCRWRDSNSQNLVSKTSGYTYFPTSALCFQYDSNVQSLVRSPKVYPVSLWKH